MSHKHLDLSNMFFYKKKVKQHRQKIRIEHD
jgi:hypothetical protein